MKPLLVATLALTGVLLASEARAQSLNPAFAAPDTPNLDSGRPSPDFANTDDRLFVREVSLGGAAEVEFGKLAGQKAQNQSVKAFARRMVDEHSKANDRLAPLASAVKAPTRKEFDLDHRVMRDELQKLNGTAFDVAYIRVQMAEHQKTAQLLEWEIGSGQDARLRAYAMQTLPAVLAEQHRKMAEPGSAKQ